MFHRSFFLRSLLLLSAAVSLYAVVGDWESYGQILDWHSLQYDGEYLWAGSDGGIIRYGGGENLTVFTNTDGLDHIDISALRIDSDGLFWIGYNAVPAKIGAGDPLSGDFQHFDLGFSAVKCFAGNDDQCFALYEKNQLPGIAHFVKSDGRVIFRDVYDQFDADIRSINTIELSGDSLLVGTDNGLYTASILNPNLKPASSWVPVITGDPVTFIRRVDNVVYFNLDTRLMCLTAEGASEETVSIGSSYPVEMSRRDGTLFMSYHKKIWKKESGGIWEILKTYDQLVNGFTAAGDSIYLALRYTGLDVISGAGEDLFSFIPNSPLPGIYQAMDLNGGHGLSVANGSGISVLGFDGSWHNIVRSDTVISVGNPRRYGSFSADTVAFTYFGGYIFDVLSTSDDRLFVSYSGVHTDYTVRYPISYVPVVRPGPLFEIDLDNYGNYTVYDTTGGVFDGSEGSVGGIDEYLVARGMTESSDGSVWIINAHATNGEPLIRIMPGGEIVKYSIEGSGGVLQALPNEMACDHYNRVWIANQYHPDNAPITSGGISIYDIGRDQWFHMNSSVHGLVNNDIRSIDVDDADGSIWIVTAGGVQMITPPSALSSTTADERLADGVHDPIEGISDITVTKLRVDVRSNKWMLSSDGGVRILLKNGTYYNGGSSYTRSNSPLLSNTVTDIVFDDVNAKAWILTDVGINSLETGWAVENRSPELIVVFPQPLDTRIHDILYFDNLPDQSDIIIATLNGTVVQTIASDSPYNFGKQVAWSFRDSGQSMLHPGVYYAFIYNVDGLKHTLKFAVRN